MASVPFNNLITFSRGSNATVTGSNGLIQWAPNNLLTFSEQFNNAAWFKGGTATVTANSVAAPDGTLTADTVVFGTVGDLILQDFSTTSDGTYVASIYLRAASPTTVVLTIQQSGGALASLTCSLTTSWQRFQISRAMSSLTFVRTLVTTNSNTPTIFAWGAQLELGSAATTYNSTTVKNLLGFSEAFSDASWTKVGASFVTGAQANPVNGLFNAQKLMENTANSQHYVAVTVTAPSAPMTLSVYAKAAGRSWLTLYLGAANTSAYFNLDTGVLGTVQSGVTASIANIGSGWYRCSITALSGVGGALTRGIYAANADNSNTYTGDGNSGVYIYGAQLSDSASLDPYVPTPAAAPSSTAYYGPRFDYDPVTLQPKGLLVEEARTNLALYSEQFDNAAWSKITATVTANATASPDGMVDADKLIPDNSASLSSSQTLQSITKAASAITYTYSVFAKVGEFNRVRLRCQDSGGAVNRADVTVSLTDGSITTAAAAAGTFTSASAAVTSFGSGWYRVALSFTSSTDTFLRWVVFAEDSVATTGNGTSGIFIYGAQLEAGAFATSYIPTVASTVTRSADVATINGSLFSQWFSTTQGSFIVQADVVGSFGNYPYMLSLSGQQGMFIQPTNILGVGRIFSNDAVTANTTSLNTAFKAAGGYSPTNPALAVLNGGTVGTGTEVWSAAADQLRLGANVISSRFLNGHIRSIDYIPARAADFQLQALTL